MFFSNPNFYYITIGLQALCVIHCIRKNNQQKWIWIIIFIPIVGSLAYLFTEILNRKDMQQMGSGVGSILNPSGSIRKLEENLRFADTFKNKVALADAYLASGQTIKAIDLYESSLSGNFTNHEHVNMQLILAYFQVNRYEDIVATAQKIYRQPQFARSRPHMYYAISLGYLGKSEEAEKEFRLMRGKFSNFECRYHYGLFLDRLGRRQEAAQVFNEIVNEKSHLNSRERSLHSQWFSKSRDELKRLGN